MPNYALIQGIFIGVVSAYVIVLALIGPENHGSHFERGKTAFQAGASQEDANSGPGSPGENEAAHYLERLSVGSAGAREKEDIQTVQNKGPARGSLV